MSDFLKKAAGLFFNVEDGEEATRPAEGEKPRQQPNTVTGTPAYTAALPSSMPDNASVEKFRKYFRDLYDKANLPGPDFYEFYNMVEAMGSLITDDIKYPSVFAGFAGMITKDKLLGSANQYLSILQQDRADFERSFGEAQRVKVQGRKEQIEKKAQEIKRLQEQIAALNNDIIQLNKDAQNDEARLSAEQSAYLQQSDAFQQKIKTGIEHINQYIK